MSHTTAASPQPGGGDTEPATHGGLSERARAERKLGWTLCAPAATVMIR